MLADLESRPCTQRGRRAASVFVAMLQAFQSHDVRLGEILYDVADLTVMVLRKLEFGVADVSHLIG